MITISKSYQHFLLSLCLLCSAQVLAQSEKHFSFKGVKIAAGYTPSLTPRQGIDEVHFPGSPIPLGMLSPAFIFGKSSSRFVEISVPMILINQTESWKTFIGEEETKGTLLTRYQTGLGIDFHRSNGTVLHRPFAWSYGGALYAGRFGFTSDVQDKLVRNSRLLGLMLNAGIDLNLWSKSNFSLDFEPDIFLFYGYSKFRYVKIDYSDVEPYQSKSIVGTGKTGSRLRVSLSYFF